MRTLFLLFFLISFQANSQTSKVVDSLFLVKSYLLEIRTTVNSKEKPQQLQKLDRLIKSATTQKDFFNRNIIKIVDNKQEMAKLKSSLNFILQSLVLYKSDISNDNDGFSEKKYLNQNIPPLVDKIIYHCKRYEDKIKFETH